MRYFRQSPLAWDKSDASPVSEADHAVNDMLRLRLSAARPDYGWLSEESDNDPVRMTAQRVFIVDPIDGTRAFLQGETAFAHALAVAEHGRITAAAVYLPAQNRLYSASLGGGATLNDRPIAASGRADAHGARVLSNAAALGDDNWSGPLPPMTRHFRPSLAYRLCLVAEGEFDAALTFRGTWEWDIAAGDLICTEAGAVCTDGAGAPVLYNSPAMLHDGLIVATSGVHADLMARRRR